MVFSIERIPGQAGKPACSSGKAWRERFKTIANLAMLPDHVAEDATVRSRGRR